MTRGENVIFLSPLLSTRARANDERTRGHPSSLVIVLSSLLSSSLVISLSSLLSSSLVISDDEWREERKITRDKGQTVDRLEAKTVN